MRWMFREQLWGWSAGARAGCDGLHLAAGGDLDARGLGVFGLGDQDAQHAVLHRSLDRVRHDMGGQGDGAAEGARGALDSVVLLLGGLAGELALALDGQQAVLQGDLQVVELDPWQLHGHQVGVAAFGDVQRWHPGRGAGPGRALPLAVQAKGVGEQAVHLDPGLLLLGAAQVPERVPLGSEHHLVLPRAWAARRPPARGQRSPGACSGCTCRVPSPYVEHCSSVKNSVQIPLVLRPSDYEDTEGRKSEFAVTVSAAQRRFPATWSQSDRGRSSARAAPASTSTSRPRPDRGALPVGLHPASPARGSSIARPHPRGTNAPFDPFCGATSYAAGNGVRSVGSPYPEGSVEQERQQPWPNAPLGTWSPFGCPGDSCSSPSDSPRRCWPP